MIFTEKEKYTSDELDVARKKKTTQLYIEQIYNR